MADERVVASEPLRGKPVESPIGGDTPPDADQPTEVMSRQGIPRFLVSRRAEITNTLGLQLRAATKLAQLAGQLRADVRVARDGHKVRPEYPPTGDARRRVWQLD